VNLRPLRAIGERAGLGGGPVLVGGAALESLDDEALAEALGDHTVIARATPADKHRASVCCSSVVRSSLSPATASTTRRR